MANPESIFCPVNEWTKVATNVITGQVHKKTEAPQEYLHTYREFGSDAPTLKEEGVAIFVNDRLSEPISSTIGIDVYIYPIGANGAVRVDL